MSVESVPAVAQRNVLQQAICSRYMSQAVLGPLGPPGTCSLYHRDVIYGCTVLH